MDTLFQEIAEGWNEVFGLGKAAKLAKAHCVRFAGLSPHIEQDRISFARALGIAPAGMERLQYLGSGAVWEISDDDTDEEDEEGRKLAAKNRKWRKVMKDLPPWSIHERGEIYLRWLQYSRTLLTFPLVTGKRQAYLDLNCFLAHV